MNKANNTGEWVMGDVFTTTFWGVPEVCIILKIDDSYTSIVRMESIRWPKTLKKDFCGAELRNEYFKRMQKTFIHHSHWYSEYRSPHPQISKT